MKRFLLTLSLVWLLLSCSNNTPDYVIGEDELEDLLIDIHLSEAVVESNNITNIPEKKKIREAVFLRHGVTQEQFDTTLVWYGHHMDKYMEVYDRVIDRLKTENEEVKALLAKENSQIMSQPGDSVDIWKLKHHHILDTRLSTSLLAFEIKPDENFFRQDYFELRFKVKLLPRLNIAPQVYMTAIHTDNSRVFNHLDIKKEGWYSLPLQTDSVSSLRLLSGYIVLPVQTVQERVYIDSLTLIRRHHNKQIPEVKEQKELMLKDPQMESTELLKKITLHSEKVKSGN